jgi:hypothetical protein
LDTRCEIAFVGDQADARKDLCLEILGWESVGNPIRDYVDDTRGSAAPITKRGWATDDLDPPCREGIDGNGVVRAFSRNILGAKAVFEHLRSVGVLTSDDRATRPCRKSRRGETGDVVQCFTEGRTEILEDLAAIDAVDGDGEFVPVVFEGRGCDDDGFGDAVLSVRVVVSMGVRGLFVGCGFGTRRRGGPEKDGWGQE